MNKAKKKKKKKKADHSKQSQQKRPKVKKTAHVDAEARGQRHERREAGGASVTANGV
jgi:hypothetical protein